MSALPTYPLARVAPEQTRMEFSCTTVIPILRYLQERLGEAETRRLVCASQMNWDYLQDRQHWVSFAYYNALLDLAVQATGDARLPFRAAQRFTDPASVSFVAVCLLRAVSIRQAYHLVAQWSGFWSKIHRAEIVTAGRASITLRNTYPHHRQTRGNCLAVQGALSAVPCHWGRPAATVTEVSCCCRGDPYCTYRVEWDEPRRLGLPYLGGALGAGAALVLILVLGWSPLTALTAAGAVALGTVLGITVADRAAIRCLRFSSQAQADSLLEAVRHMEELNQSLQTTVETRTGELSAANARLQNTLEELRASHERVLQTEREAAIGVLAAGMAHELNSPLNAIRLAVQALREGGPDAAERAPLLALAERATRRCRRIVNDLLAFARDPSVSRTADLREAVTRAIATYREETPEPCPIEVNLAPDFPPLKVDWAQIQQAVTNLLNNAHDAMAGHGRINVSLSRLEPNAAAVIIADTGPGVSAATRARLFEPFFSTKTAGHGLGIGLSLTRHLVERHGGRITLDSAPGEGATFTLIFPCPALTAVSETPR